MSVTTFDPLFDFRGELEKNLTSAIAGDLANYTRLNSPIQKDRARFECVVKIGSPLGHKKLLTPTDRRYDMFNFTFSINVISTAPAELVQEEGEALADFTARVIAQNSFHPQLVAHMDAYMSQIQLSSKDDLITFPKLTLLLLRGSGHQPALKPEAGTEETKLNFTGQFGIRPEAWLV